MRTEQRSARSCSLGAREAQNGASGVKRRGNPIAGGQRLGVGAELGNREFLLQ